MEGYHPPSAGCLGSRDPCQTIDISSEFCARTLKRAGEGLHDSAFVDDQRVVQIEEHGEHHATILVAGGRPRQPRNPSRRPSRKSALRDELGSVIPGTLL